MLWQKTIRLSLIILLAVFPALTSCKMYKDMQAMKEPRYELGAHRGAAFCAGCHKVIYDQWLKRSRHAVATTNKNFLKTRDGVMSSFALNLLMGDESCHACHGSRETGEGVDCETCHGIADKGIPIMDTHRVKFKLGRTELQGADFCAKCHELFPPLMSPYSDWKASEAARRNMTCQACHMEKRQGALAYHGFDSILINDDIYLGDVALKDIDLDFPRFSISVENRIKGHGVPAGGPSRVLVLDIKLIDASGREVHNIKEKFYKKFKLIPFIGGMPTNELIEDTQLKSSEVRRLEYTLPSSLKQKVSRAIITLKFYDVEDRYQGDINKAHWISEPVVMETVDF